MYRSQLFNVVAGCICVLTALPPGTLGDPPGVPHIIERDIYTYEGDAAYSNINITCVAPQLGVNDTVQIYKSLLFWSLLKDNVTIDGSLPNGDLRFLVSTGDSLNVTNHAERYSIVRNNNSFAFQISDPEAMDSGIYACRTLVQDGSEGDVIIESQDHSNVTVIEPVPALMLFTAENLTNLHYVMNGSAYYDGEHDFYFGCEAWLNNGQPYFRSYWEDSDGNKTDIDEEEWNYAQGSLISRHPVFNDSDFFHTVNHSILLYSHTNSIRDIGSHIGQKLVCEVAFPGIDLLPLRTSILIYNSTHHLTLTDTSVVSSDGDRNTNVAASEDGNHQRSPNDTSDGNNTSPGMIPNHLLLVTGLLVTIPVWLLGT